MLRRLKQLFNQNPSHLCRLPWCYKSIRIESARYIFSIQFVIQLIFFRWLSSYSKKWHIFCFDGKTVRWILGACNLFSVLLLLLLCVSWALCLMRFVIFIVQSNNRIAIRNDPDAKFRYSFTNRVVLLFTGFALDWLWKGGQRCERIWCYLNDAVYKHCLTMIQVHLSLNTYRPLAHSISLCWAIYII